MKGQLGLALIEKLNFRSRKELHFSRGVSWLRTPAADFRSVLPVALLDKDRIQMYTIRAEE
jgi:hypothetical protein